MEEVTLMEPGGAPFCGSWNHAAYPIGAGAAGEPVCFWRCARAHTGQGKRKHPAFLSLLPPVSCPCVLPREQGTGWRRGQGQEEERSRRPGLGAASRLIFLPLLARIHSISPTDLPGARDSSAPAILRP